jgi:hypothetical protein
MQHAGDLLKKLTNFKDDFFNGLVSFYGSKKFNMDFKLTWQEALDYYKNKPDISVNELAELKGVQVPRSPTPVEIVSSKEQTDKDGKKGKKKTKNGGKTAKKGGEKSTNEQTDQSPEESNLQTDRKEDILAVSSPDNKTSSKTKTKKFTIKSESDTNNKTNGSVVSDSKNTHSISNVKSSKSSEKSDKFKYNKLKDSIAESETSKTDRSNTFIGENQISVHVKLKESTDSNKISSHFLPTSSKMWKYYKEREGF